MKYLIIAVFLLNVCAARDAARMKPLSKAAGANNSVDEKLLPLLSEAEQKPPHHKGLTAIGVGRMVPQTAMAQGSWQTLPTGATVWRMAIHSPKAWGLRLHFTRFDTGDGKVWLYVNGKADDAFAGPYTGKGVFGDGEFWSEPVEGSSVVIEYAPAQGSGQGEIPFQVDQISHLYAKPLRANQPRASALDVIRTGPADREFDPFAGTVATAAQNTCSPDVSCFAQWSTAASAVASIAFVSGGNSYVCTGSLIEDAARSGQPLLLTANHCIADAVTARTVVAHFQYQTTSCNGALPSYSDVPKVTGASYLTSRPIAQGDFSLLLLSAPAPAGSTFLSWSGATDPLVGESVVGIHHPGTLLDGSAPNGTRISFGQRSSSQTSSVDGELMPASVNIAVDWLPGQGYTEPGSSGSPLLSSSGKLLGTLTGGTQGPLSSPCNPTSALAVYGRFATALTTLSSYLGVSATATGCFYSITQSNITVPASGGTGSVMVGFGAGCPLPAAATQTWVSASGSSFGQGSGAVNYSAAWNSTGLPRVAAIQTGAQALQLLQTGTNTPQYFTDVPSSYVFFDYIAILRNAGVITGCTAAQFCPDDAMNRLDMAVFLVHAMLGTDTFSYNPTPYFGDIPSTSPYFRYVQKLRELGATSGCQASPPLYCGTWPVTRAQMAKFLVTSKVGEAFQYSPAPYFDDVPPSHWAFRYVQKMRDLGITSGCGTRSYCPDSPNTRGQVSVFLTRGFFSGVGF